MIWRTPTLRAASAAIALALALFVASCAPTRKLDVVDPLPAPDPRPAYFPEGVFGGQWDGQIRRNLIERVLASVNEPSFIDPKNARFESYRCVWPMFEDSVVVRIIRDDRHGHILVATRGRYGPRLARHAEVSQASWDHVRKLSDDLDFWNQPAWVDEEALPTWVLEGRKDGRYHVVARPAPAEGDPLRTVCLYFLALAWRPCDYPSRACE